MNILVFEDNDSAWTSSCDTRYKLVVHAFSRAVNGLGTVWYFSEGRMQSASDADRCTPTETPGKFAIAFVHFTDWECFKKSRVVCDATATYGGGCSSVNGIPSFHRALTSQNPPITDAEATQIVDWVANGASVQSLPSVLRPAAVSPAERRDLLLLLCSAYLIRGRELLQLRGEQLPVSCKTAAPFPSRSPSRGHAGSLSLEEGAERIGCDYWDLDGMEASGEDRLKPRLCTEDVFRFSAAGIEAVSDVFGELTGAAPAPG